jgi:hypothetical protein
MATKVRNALTHFRPLTESQNVGIRLHATVLYNSIYRANGKLFVNQHAYGIPAAHSPVSCFRKSGGGDMITEHLKSFERVWMKAKPIHT